MIEEDWPLTVTPPTSLTIQPSPRLTSSANPTVTSGIQRNSGLR